MRCWLDCPSRPYRQARNLRSLAAIDEAGQITGTGRQLAALPIHPRLGHMLLMAGKIGQASLACDISALLSERDIIRGDGCIPTADLHLRLELLELWRKKGADAVSREGGD
jgi:ATP-dependent helicase HrpB